MHSSFYTHDESISSEHLGNIERKSNVCALWMKKMSQEGLGRNSVKEARGEGNVFPVTSLCSLCTLSQSLGSYAVYDAPSEAAVYFRCD